MAIKSYELPKVDILNGGGVTNFLVNKGTETAQLPASLLPQILTADKLLMPDGVTSINRRLQQIGSGNLIDNADFSINQRGVTSWTSGYGLDRYRCDRITAHVIDQGVRLVSDSTTYSGFYQIIDRSIKNGDIVTLSALIKGNSGFRLIIGRAVSSSNAAVNIPASDDWELISVTTTLSNLSRLVAKIDHPEAVAGDEIIIHRWKLEPGPFQTLAHREGNTWVLNDPPPNYALELLKCQRYQCVFKSSAYKFFSLGIALSSSELIFYMYLPNSLRSHPTCTAEHIVVLNASKGEQPSKAKEISIKELHIVQNVVRLHVTTKNTGDALVPGDIYQLISTNVNGKLLFDSNL